MSRDDKLLFAYLSGFLDADGSYITTRDQFGKVCLFVDFYDSDKPSLEWIEKRIEQLGFYGSLRLNKSGGSRTKKYGIIHRTDYWQLSFYGMNNINDLIAKLRPRHPEKIGRRLIAVSTFKGQDYSVVQVSVETLRAEIDRQVSEFVELAKEKYLGAHPI